MEELLLWRWSTTVQITSAIVLAIFMVAFGRAVGRPDTRWWAGAYVANLGAMAVTVLYWYGVPPELVPDTVTRFAYMGSKTLFILCLAAGVFAFRHPLGYTPFTVRRSLLLAAGVGVFGALSVPTINLLGLAQHALIARGAWPGSVVVFPSSGHGPWLAGHRPGAARGARARRGDRLRADRDRRRGGPIAVDAAGAGRAFLLRHRRRMAHRPGLRGGGGAPLGGGTEAQPR